MGFIRSGSSPRRTCCRNSGLILWFRFRVLKFFAVCFGLRLAFGQYPYAGSMPFARRNSSQTPAKKFLMHAPAKRIKSLFAAEIAMGVFGVDNDFVRGRIISKRYTFQHRWGTLSRLLWKTSGNVGMRFYHFEMEVV